MSLESGTRINSILDAVASKMHGVKPIHLTSAVQILCDSYKGTVGTEYTPLKKPELKGAQIKSIGRLANIIDRANQTTGYNDTTLTAAVQRLCDGYQEGLPLYSIGVLSDTHIQYETGIADFQRALNYLKNRVSFTCICGDLVSYATAEHMQTYKDCVENYAGNMPIYECAGNHESYPALGVGGDVDTELWMATTGKPLYYSFTHKAYTGQEDLFIMFSMKSERPNDLWPDGAMEWLEKTLNLNKNKRCFLFQHAPELADRSADPSGTWSSLMEGTSGRAFVNLIKRYPNVVWFHGHTHVTLGAERYPVSDELGYRSVHIPSLTSPRFYMPDISNTLIDSYIDENGNTIWGSTLAEGYIVDVYANKIVLRGIDFAASTSGGTGVREMVDEIYALDTVF